MKNSKQKLIIEQLDKKIEQLHKIDNLIIPSEGWVYSIRTAMKMTLRQLGNRVGITAQSIKEIETREKSKTISIKTLTEVAKAFDMKFVYGFIPKEKNIEKIIEKKAYEIAEKIVFRTSKTMQLEAQENSRARINKAIKNRAEEIKREMPKYLWD
ncbi:MAG: XRE family transcriptional regulator [Bacteroidetes bacterium GWA2_30_7]|nr:MAG: XRE family transcriptional regulator [Bacteroidetes bacterium GWA2_30_7]